eukprot:TRINITY_DN10511_c0_g1_i1.p1 TRINITY_DN10511_c0_g1~~TRINITY_DN10511_c0_g1_i1.p1  ORF type:complete len:102 (+),score=11.31 TRINITY_DN10511_c0_g1_i1:95-400(+)
MMKLISDDTEPIIAPVQHKQGTWWEAKFDTILHATKTYHIMYTPANGSSIAYASGSVFDFREISDKIKVKSKSRPNCFMHFQTNTWQVAITLTSRDYFTLL